MRKVLLGILILSLSMSFFLFVSCEKDATKPPEEPEVKLVSPVKNEVLIDSVSVEITATDDKGITQVEFIVDNEVAKTWIMSPYVYTWNVTDLSDSSEHSVYARAYDADGNVSTTPVVKVLVMLLSAPTNLSAQTVSDTQILLTWQDNSKIEDGFRIERKEEDGNYFQIAEVSANVNSFDDAGLTYGTNYYYRVRAFTSQNNSVYSNELFIPWSVIDIDGNVYRTVKIGNQMWMAENLRVSHYRNGDVIPNITDNMAWNNLSTGALCDYNNDVNNVVTYGRLYNWYAVNDSRNIAPTGWHVPTDAEWQTLVNYLGGESVAVAGGKMKEVGTTHWQTPNTGATNESGFSALPGGHRDGSGAYLGIGYGGYWWSATENNSSDAWSWSLGYGYSGIYRGDYDKRYGFSVRCVGD
ncbi:MAG: FISUMP domain-containing protein [archaeon]